MSIDIPEKGAIFWPVGNGDSSTFIVDGSTFLQVDLHHTEKSDDESEDAHHIIDDLKDILPEKDGKPYLSVFALTHPDKDHILGFEELLEEVEIGEIWHTPRVFIEFKKDLCEDATVFVDEVERRKDEVCNNPDSVESGDLVRVFGHDDIFEEADYEDFPDQYKSYPGNTLTEIDGGNYEGIFEVFVHAPFKDGNEGERNETSLAIQLSLIDNGNIGKSLLFGDLSYPTLRRIYDVTYEKDKDEYLEWDLLLAPHHCSKKAMYWETEDDEGKKLQKDIMEDLEESSLDSAYIVSNSKSEFSDGDGDNPPHQKARNQYEKIIDAGHFQCTHEHEGDDGVKPLVFELTEQGLVKEETKAQSKNSASKLSEGVAEARGGTKTHKKEHGFG